MTEDSEDNGAWQCRLGRYISTEMMNLSVSLARVWALTEKALGFDADGWKIGDIISMHAKSYNELHIVQRTGKPTCFC